MSRAISIEVPESVRPLFLAAGWHPGRRVPVPSTVPIGHPVAMILAEFGGLIVGKGGAGVECAAGEACFHHYDPYADYIDEVDPFDRIENMWGTLLGFELICVAAVNGQEGAVYIDSIGRTFGATHEESFYFWGATFGEGIERLLLGRRARPMFLPDTHRAMVYGEWIDADHPSVYRYRYGRSEENPR
jgi:SUKH-3 immunity protein